MSNRRERSYLPSSPSIRPPPALDLSHIPEIKVPHLRIYRGGGTSLRGMLAYDYFRYLSRKEKKVRCQRRAF